MPETLQEPEASARKENLSPVTLVIGAVVLLAIGLSLCFLFKPVDNKKTVTFQQAMPSSMTPAERDYTKNIQVEKLALRREENFLHQVVTTLSGEVLNNGTKPVVALMLTIEFHDTMNQIVLRETRSILGVRAAPLAPGERREFEIAFDNIPPSWDMQQPSLQFALLRLPETK
jgi:hypothetical protein